MAKRKREDDNAVYVADDAEEGLQELKVIFPEFDEERLAEAFAQAKGAGGDRVEAAVAFLLDPPGKREATPLLDVEEVIDVDGTPPPAAISHALSFSSGAVQEMLVAFPDVEPSVILSLLDRAMHAAKGNVAQASASVVEKLLASGGNGSGETVDLPLAPPPPVAPVNAELADLTTAFPDADPNWLFAELEKLEGKEDRVMIISNRCLEDKGYPKRETKTKRTGPKRPGEYGFKECLDDTTDYRNASDATSELYKKWCLSSLLNDFPFLPKAVIMEAVAADGRYINARSQLKLIYSTALPPTNRKTRRKAQAEKAGLVYKLLCQRPPEKEPEEPCERFFREKAYSWFEDEILEFREEEKRMHDMKVKQAEECGQMVECGCCYCDYIIEDMGQCSDGHLFCLDCCRRAAAEIIGQGGLNFRCLTADCTFSFPLSECKRFLQERVYEKHIQRIQQAELKKAGIPNLVECKYCHFAVIMEPEDTVFKCQNDECMRETCRLCGEDSHIPLRCNEVEKKDEMAMRKFIEEKMTEALCRTCPKCSRKFYKTEGCNKMTCECGLYMCYVCGKVLGKKDPYSHFKEGGCTTSMDTAQFNNKRVNEGGKLAMQEYLAQNPEAASLELKHNPLGAPPKKKKKKKNDSNGNGGFLANVVGYLAPNQYFG